MSATSSGIFPFGLTRKTVTTLGIITQALRDIVTWLKSVARRKGYAVGIGHPFPETLDVLEKELPALEAAGFEVVTISTLLRQEWNRI